MSTRQTPPDDDTQIDDDTPIDDQVGNIRRDPTGFPKGVALGWGMFFPTVIILVIAVVVILYLALS